MTITTQDCKDFIDNLSNTIHSFSDTWKRTRKYKEDKIVLRNFENQNGRILTIAEHGGKLFLYALSGETFSEISLDSYGNQYIGHAATKADVLAFIRKCVEEDHEIVDSEAVADALRLSSWVIWNTWSTKQKPNQYDTEPMSEFFANANDTENLYAYYGDENGDSICMNQDEIAQVFWVGMSDYDTAYRIFIFETKDHRLILGCNEPD